MSEADARSRLAAVRQEIARACATARRDPAEVTLVAVSKTFGADAIAPVLGVDMLDAWILNHAQPRPDVSALASTAGRC